MLGVEASDSVAGYSLDDGQSNHSSVEGSGRRATPPDREGSAVPEMSLSIRSLASAS